MATARKSTRQLDKRGIRRMLITTLGRIERLEEFRDHCLTDKERKEGTRVSEINADIAEQRAKLREYNAMAEALIAAERA